METFDDLPDNIRRALAAADFDVNAPSKIITELRDGTHPDDIVEAIAVNDARQHRRRRRR